MPKPAIAQITENLPIESLKALGAINVSLSSIRSIRFDLPFPGKTEDPTTVLRIKMTAQEDGEIRIRTYKVTEIDDIPGVIPENLVNAIKMLASGGGA